jgi:GMP synthase PP-ATPase subunit
MIALLAQEVINFMIACCADLPSKLLEIVSSRIINEITGVSLATYECCKEAVVRQK